MASKKPSFRLSGKMTEHELQTSIIQYLQLKKYYVMRLNSGVIPSFYKGEQRMIRLSKKGTPDLLAFRGILEPKYNYVKLIFIEVKLPKKKPTPEQEEMMKELEFYGAKCFVAHSVEELDKFMTTL